MATNENAILGLTLPTDPRWIDLATLSMDDILNDHAYCEQKAALVCISLIQLHSDKPELVEALAPIVSEEWGHFRLVLAEMKKRNIALQAQRKDEYVNALSKFKLKGGTPKDRLVDRLLICALIEARSCERFRILSEGLAEQRMRAFYHKFMVSEAGHYRLFLDLAKNYLPENQVKMRWQFWLDTEKKVLQHLPLRGDRMH